MSFQIFIWKDKCQKWDDIVICQPLKFSPDYQSSRWTSGIEEASYSFIDMGL